MVIGIDIDKVISDFDEGVLKECFLEDKKKRNRGIVNKDADGVPEMFDWSREEIDEFYNNNMERIAKNLKVRRNCKKCMDKMLEDGHRLILISHRAYPHYVEPFKTTTDWLKSKNINYTKLVLSKTPEKVEECKNYKVDLMFDDRVVKCKIMRENGINCYLVITRYNWRLKGNLPYVTSWKNIYEVVSKYAKNS